MRHCTLITNPYWQLLILALRPLFFIAVKSAIGADFVSDTWRDVFGDKEDKIRESYILECSAAARRNLWLGRHINELCNVKGTDGINTNGKLVMLDLHHIFNAAVVLLLYQMVSRNVVNTDNFGITEARRIFATEAAAEGLVSGSGGGGATGYASDCVGVLDDLAALVAHIRPLRFKDSEYVNTGIEVNWGMGIGRQPTPAASSLGCESSSNGDGGGCSTGTLGSPVAMLSTEQLTANLSLRNPYGPDGVYPQEFGGDNQQQMGISVDSYTYTIRKEMERWLREDNGQFQFSGVPPGGYTGL